ncbi:13057_t:CDS:2 [Cetraspora pellucida]|uniref:13057_t:CDS:1 n=1 Tax=Cetraspora pellucida TaxID=1433469 RepID=A0A9N9I5V4_9GLOM|nr:13057_t:CDS:2 [Cetraspora pellucida]
MRESNCHILLILDQAPTHVILTLSFTNVKVLFLPSKTTSKLQPMDAGIITSFKLHYCCLQLQHAIDLDEAGKVDIYKAKIAWNEVSAETIKNCWFHTKIVSPHDETGKPISTSIINDLESIEDDPTEELIFEEL